MACDAVREHKGNPNLLMTHRLPYAGATLISPVACSGPGQPHDVTDQRVGGHRTLRGPRRT